MMKISRIFLGSISILLFAFVAKGANSSFGIDAYNRAVSSATRGNVVFSPVSFEIDCVIFSEAYDPIVRAKFAESLGVLNGLESFYLPIQKQLSNCADSGFSFLHARAFCLPDERKTNRAYRGWLQQTFSAEAFSMEFIKGAECWFRSRLDGDMEDFTFPEKTVSAGNYSYFDVVSIAVPSPVSISSTTNAVIHFHTEEDVNVPVEAMRFTCAADTWTHKNITVIRIPLETNVCFFAMIPDEGKRVRDVRLEFSSATIHEIVTGHKSVINGARHGFTSVSIPALDIASDSDLKRPFGYFRFPLTEFARIENHVQPRHVRQMTRFRMVKRNDSSARVQSSATTDIRQITLDRPFMFFVHHEPTSTVLVCGQFMGR